MMYLRYFSILMLLLLLSCVRKPTDNVISLPDNSSRLDSYIPLLAPATFGKNQSITQHVILEFEKFQTEFVLRIEINFNSMTVIALSLYGSTMFSIVYNGSSISTSGSGKLMKAINPTQLLSEIQFSIWPLQPLKQALNYPKLYIQQSDTFRSLILGNTIIAKVLYQPSHDHFNGYVLTQNNHQYTVKVDTLSVENLSSD